MSKQTDLIIIGAGPAGYRAADYAARQGLRVVIFEGDQVGGTCLNVGCIPTKTWVHASSFDEARRRMAQVVPQLRAGVESILAHPHITLVRQEGVFADAHTVGDFSAPHVMVATGSLTRWLPVPGGRGQQVVDSTALLALPTLPRRLCIVGAGVIGMEFASVCRRFGAEVTVVEYLKECLPALDTEVARRLRKCLEKEGVVFKLQSAVSQIAGGVVTFENKKGLPEVVESDLVLMATGRQPRVYSHFDRAGFQYDARRGIAVDAHFQTTVPGVYAVGDVNGLQMLAHAAEMQAIHAVNHILGRPDAIRFDVMPAAIFTSPEAACVGPTEEQLQSASTPYECRKSFWRANGKALAMGATEGLLKLFSEPGAGCGSQV